MESSFWKQAAKFLREHRSRRSWTIFVICLAVIVTAGTITALTYTGRAMTRAGRVLDCPLSVHEHTQSCYDDEGNLICGQADYVVHTHNDDCYDKDSELVCTLPEIPEHRHDDSCYTTETVLVCGQSESDGHVHDSSCYGSEPDQLTCGMEEHTHSDECYDAETGELICGYEEHTHGDDCYTAGGEYLACGMEEGEGAHHHTDGCYESREVLTCGKLENHTHDEHTCYDEYGNLTCTETVLEEHIHTDACFRAPDEEPDDVAEPDSSPEPDGENASAEPGVEDAASDEASGEPEVTILSVSTEHYTVSVSYGPEAEIPEDAELRVVEYPADSEEYQARVAEAAIAETSDEESAETAGGETTAPGPTSSPTTGGAYTHALLDVGFWVGDTEIEPAAPVSVTVTVTDMNAEGDVTVTHFAEDGETQLLTGEDVTTVTEEDGRSAITFELPSFSNILVTYASGISPLADVDVTDLAGEWVIVNEAGKYALTSSTTKSSSGNSALTASGDYKLTNDQVVEGTATVWLFEQVSGTSGQYYISTTVSGKKQYLRISGYNVTLTTSRSALTVASAGDGKIYISNGSYRLNRYNKEAVFAAWNDDSVHSQQTLYKVAGSNSLKYDLGLDGEQFFNVSSSNNLFNWNKANQWLQYTDGKWVSNTTGNILSLKSPTQSISESGSNLYSPAGDFSYAPVYGGDSTIYVYESQNSSIRNVLPASCPPGIEIEFLGWQWTDDSGNTWYFDCGAAATATAEGIQIEGYDAAGSAQTVTVPGGATLTGRWREVSNLAVFFVNYAGTILDVQTSSISGSQLWTPAIAIGRVYQPTNDINGDLKTEDTRAVNNEIRDLFSNTVTGEDMQLVIQYVALPNDDISGSEFALKIGSGEGTANFITKGGLNPTELDISLFKYVKTLEKDITLVAADGYKDVKINKDKASPDNYGVRWYSFKELNDCWHIDGVLEAKTTKFGVYKTFVGLGATQRDSILEKYNIAVGINEQITSDMQVYMDMTTHPNAGEERYQYLGDTDLTDTSHRYDWSVNAITGEYYGFKENNYQLDGYEVTPEVVYRVRNADGTITMQTKMGADGLSPAEDGIGEALIGSNVESMYFNNYYTPVNTGSLVIEKTNKSGSALLSGAEFTLTPEGTDSTPITVTTNQSGVAYFSELKVGTYELTETKAPEGYSATAQVWMVEVTAGTRGAIKVTVTTTIDGKTSTETVFENDQLLKRLTITNEPVGTTLVVKKVFEEIEPGELASLVAGSHEGAESPYYISLDEKPDIKLYLQDAARTGNEFMWAITDMDAGSYALTEYNYLLLDEYTDTAVTVVTAAYQGATCEVTKDHAKKTATAHFVFEQHPVGENALTLTNRYTDTFTLRLAKVDSEDGNKPLPGAVFKIYGGYQEATSTGDSITVDGTTYYYKGSMTSDENGICTIDGLKLSGGKGTFVYVMDESTAPDGYEKPPAYTILQVSVGDENYDSDGVYKIRFPNTHKLKVTTKLTVTKNWLAEPPGGMEVVMTSYRSKNGADMERLDSFTLTAETGWSHTWDVSRYYQDGEEYKEYTYYISETPVAGYSAIYGDSRTELTVDGAAVSAGTAAKDADGSLSVTITNAQTYELPRTGGSGTALYLLGGGGILLLGLAFAARHMKRRYRRSGT